MKYPCLVEKRFCKIPVHIEIAREGYGNRGEPLEAIIYDGLCNYQEKAKTVLTAEKKLVEITGTACFPGDICPEIATISGGEITIFGEVRRIAAGSKARNPDGTVNYSVIEVV